MEKQGAPPLGGTKHLNHAAGGKAEAKTLSTKGQDATVPVTIVGCILYWVSMF